MKRIGLLDDGSVIVQMTHEEWKLLQSGKGEIQSRDKVVPVKLPREKFRERLIALRKKSDLTGIVEATGIVYRHVPEDDEAYDDSPDSYHAVLWNWEMFVEALSVDFSDGNRLRMYGLGKARYAALQKAVLGE